MSTTKKTTETAPVRAPVHAGSGLGTLLAAAGSNTNSALVSQGGGTTLTGLQQTLGKTASDILSTGVNNVASAAKKTGSSRRGSAPAPTNPYASQMNAAQSRLNAPLPTYTDSYADRIAAMESTGPDAYVSKYQPQVDATLEALQNRKAFRYDMSKDPLYRQYAAMYAQQGKRAMQDTVGQVAALTGGYGSSYAGTAGSQAYQQHLNQLNDKTLELAALARQHYDQEGSDMRANLAALQSAEGQNRQNYESDRAAWYDQLAMLQQGQANEYQQHRDAVNDYWQNQADAWNQYTYWNDKWAKMQ